MPVIKIEVKETEYGYGERLLVTVSDMTPAQEDKAWEILLAAPGSMSNGREEGWVQTDMGDYIAWIYEENGASIGDSSEVVLAFPLLADLNDPNRLLDLGLEPGETNEAIELEQAFTRLLPAIPALLRPIFTA